MSQVPAATRTLRVLRFLAGQPDPVPLDRIMRACELPRSTTYHLLNAMVEEGFVVHLADEHRYGLGLAAFEIGSGYARQEPLQRIARRPLAPLVDRVGHSAHLAVLHGREVLYVLEERAPGRPPLVTDVGVRLPAHLTASGRAILAQLPASQVRALYPTPADFVDRTRPRAAHAERAAHGAVRHPAARVRRRGRRGDPRPGQRRGGGPRPQPAPGRRGRGDLPRRRADDRRAWPRRSRRDRRLALTRRIGGHERDRTRRRRRPAPDLLAGVLWGTGGLAVHVIRDAEPMSVVTISAWRMLIGAVVLLVAVAVVRQLGDLRALVRRPPGAGACSSASPPRPTRPSTSPPSSRSA